MMADSKRREMAQISYFNSPKRTPRYQSLAPSPLNPTLRESEIQMGRHIHSIRKARPITKKSPEVSPTLRLLRRKAAIAKLQYERTLECSLPLQDGVMTVAPDCYEASSDVTEGARAQDIMPAFVVESGPLIQVVRMEYVRQDMATDLEKQAGADLRLLRPSHGLRQRLQFLLVLSLMSACFTFLTVFGFDALRVGHYIAG